MGRRAPDGLGRHPETDASDRLSGSGPSQRAARDRWSNLQQCNADNNPAC
ncbi:MAG: hypothetical protein ACI8PZ_004738, partial [Myxococcota bacterium]